MIFFATGRIAATMLILVSAASVARAADDVVARIGDTAITLEQVEKQVRAQLIEIDSARYEALKGGVDQLIGEQMLAAEAKERGLTAQALLTEEVTARLKQPSDEEIANVYEASKEGLGDATLDQVRPQIIEFLAERQRASATQEYLAKLREKYKPQILLAAPKFDVTVGDLEGRGPASAPIVIVAFSDYECPYCKRAEETVEEVIALYGDKVRYYHRDFPLAFHANARPAANAARCANEQGKFWAYRTALFAGGTFSAERYGAIADETGLDRAKFDECVKIAKFDDGIDRDMAAAAEVGVNGTPAFFINGRMLSGAQPLDAFKAAIDAELAAAAAN